MMKESAPVLRSTENRQKKENIWNVANLLTLFRIIITFLTAYFIFAGFHIVYVTLAFITGMLTDFLDGQAARRLKVETEFGRKFDMIADRILMLGVVLALIIKFSLSGILTKIHLFQIFFILSREITTAPAALIAAFKGAGFPQVRFVGKITTVMQAITFPMILLSTAYKCFNLSLYFAIITGIVGLISAFYYINDVKILVAKKTNK
jgi:CDP-diacylglycerol--glycerol-3-phosphate 3-phosphatidyltransferase